MTAIDHADRIAAGPPDRPAAEPGARLAALRARAPLVQCVTNHVAMATTANALLALGAAPAMVHDPAEAGAFAALADAAAVNIGTPSDLWLEGMARAAAGATAAGRPWTLDPVAVFATAYRREAAARLIALRPTLIRGNASEIRALAGLAAAGRGADAGDAVEEAAEAAARLARETGAVVAATGPVDLVTDGARVARVANGHPLMTRVTALGCALSAVCAAFLAVERDPLAATVAALAVFGAAGEAAAQGGPGPGSFAVRFLDALAAITPGEADARARILA